MLYFYITKDWREGYTDMQLTHFILAFVEGFGLILSPCILPILPIVLSGGMTGGKQRPLGIVIGFALFFAVFSLSSSALIRYAGLNIEIIQKLSYALLILFGVILISDRLSDLFSSLTQNIAEKGHEYIDHAPSSGFGGGIVFGALVSLIWVPCGGPILAAAIISMAVEKTFINSFFLFLFFALGAMIPMIFIALLGKSLITHLQVLKRHLRGIRKLLGAIIIVFAILTGFLNVRAPWSGMTTAAAIQPDTAYQKTQLINPTMPYPAPALNDNAPWLNSPPLNIQELKGKVVLIDFWTYSCINCIRTLPYLRDWYSKYHDKGLVIIGVHAPEFAFEKNINNVKAAIKQYDIRYPVVLDNDYVIWQNYNNSYWPAHYLIAKDGDVVYQHFGEGDYAITEHNIRLLLGLSATSPKPALPFSMAGLTQTPETYLGSERASGYAGNPELSAQNTQYDFPSTLSTNQWALKGSWNINPHYVQSTSANATIKLHFNARNVYMVMGSIDNQPIKMSILLNGKPVQDKQNPNNIEVIAHKLYPVLSLPASTDGELEVQFDKPGVQVYTFTFG